MTFTTYTRAPFLATPEIHSAFGAYCRRAAEFYIGVGRYVLMPDHVHLFLCFGVGCTLTLGQWIKGLKRHLDAAFVARGCKPIRRLDQKLTSYWQPGFHDHLLRSDESYSEKWAYVLQNPVRAGFVSRAEDWPFAGEIVRIDRT